MGHSATSNIVGIGDILLETNLRYKLLLKAIMHVPDMLLNLIFIGNLNDEGIITGFGESTCKLTKGSIVVARRRKTNTLYVL